jgi:hypothetical protein
MARSTMESFFTTMVSSTNSTDQLIAEKVEWRIRKTLPNPPYEKDMD